MRSWGRKKIETLKALNPKKIITPTENYFAMVSITRRDDPISELLEDFDKIQVEYYPIAEVKENGKRYTVFDCLLRGDEKQQIDYLKAVVENCPRVEKIELIGVTHESTSYRVFELEKYTEKRSLSGQLEDRQIAVYLSYDEKQGDYTEHRIISAPDEKTLREVLQDEAILGRLEREPRIKEVKQSLVSELKLKFYCNRALSEKHLQQLKYIRKQKMYRHYSQVIGRSIEFYQGVLSDIEKSRTILGI